MLQIPFAAAIAVTAAVKAAGCAGPLMLTANPNGALMYDKTSLSASAGTVKIQFTNNSPLMHNVTVEQGTSGPIIGATPTFQGGSMTLTLNNVAAGTYTFFCSVDGHRMAGMQGTLTVS